MKNFIENIVNTAEELNVWTWKELVFSVSPAKARQFHKQREDFVKKMLGAVCNKSTSTCTVTGSNRIISDKDITVAELPRSLLTLTALDDYMRRMFAHVLPKATALVTAKRLLDLNFYISDYDIVRDYLENTDDVRHKNICRTGKEADKHIVVVWDKIQCAFIHGNRVTYLSSKKNVVQRAFAFAKWKTMWNRYVRNNNNVLLKAYRKTQRLRRQCDDDQTKMKGYPKHKLAREVCSYGQYIKNIKCHDLGQPTANGNNNVDIDKAINLIGLITLKETDAYSTQGSYYRWARGIRELPIYMLIDCLIEQICMAMEHLPREAELPSVLKYVCRAVMTWDDIQEAVGTKVKLPPLFPHSWWSHMRNYMQLRKRVKLPIAHLKLAQKLASPRLHHFAEDCRAILQRLHNMKELRAFDYDV